MMKRIGIYCDISNLYFCVRERYKTKVDYKKFMKFCAGYGDVKIAKAYGAAKPKQADKFKIALQKIGFETNFKTPKTYKSGTDRQQSKADQDINITLDVRDDAHELDMIILATADGDFAPLVDRLLGMEKEVVIIGCGVSHELGGATQVIEIPPMVLL